MKPPSPRILLQAARSLLSRPDPSVAWAWGAPPVAPAGLAALALSRCRAAPVPLSVGHARFASTCTDAGEQASSARFWLRGLSPEVRAGLAVAGIDEPTAVQRAAVPAITSGGDVFLAAETGSGKTFAYLAPLFSMLRGQEAAGYVSQPNRPRVVVMVPTLELVSQVGGVAKRLAHHAKVKVVPLEGGHGVCTRRLKAGCDIVVGTPARLQGLRNKGVLYMSHVKHIVLDEADTLIEESFWDDVRPLVATKRAEFRDDGDSRATPKQKTQLIAVAATVKRRGYELLRTRARGMVLVQAPGFRRPPSQIKQRFVKVLGHDGKIVELINQLRNRKWDKLLVFCNTAPACTFVAQTLLDIGVDATTLHGDLHPKVRRTNFKRFSELGGVLVLTDVGSRGLDFPDVNLVMLYDLPGSTMDYLHRIGRTGRAGRSGTSVTLVSRKDEAKVHDLQMALKDQQGFTGLLTENARKQIDGSV